MTYNRNTRVFRIKTKLLCSPTPFESSLCILILLFSCYLMCFPHSVTVSVSHVFPASNEPPQYPSRSSVGTRTPTLLGPASPCSYSRVRIHANFPMDTHTHSRTLFHAPLRRSSLAPFTILGIPPPTPSSSCG